MKLFLQPPKCHFIPLLFAIPLIILSIHYPETSTSTLLVTLALTMFSLAICGSRPKNIILGVMLMYLGIAIFAIGIFKTNFWFVVLLVVVGYWLAQVSLINHSYPYTNRGEAI